MLSVVIPTQNEAAVIGARLDEIEAAHVAGHFATDSGTVKCTHWRTNELITIGFSHEITDELDPDKHPH